MKKETYIKWATRPSCVVRETPFVFFMLRRGLKRFLSIPVDKDKAAFYLDKKSYLTVLATIARTIRRNPHHHLANYYRYARILITKAQLVSEHVSASPAVRWRYYNDFFNFFIQYSLYLVASFAVEEYIVPKVLERFPDHAVTITAPSKLFQYQRLEIAAFKEGPETLKKRFGWMNVYNYYENEYPLNFFVELKKQITQERIATLRSDVARVRRKFQRFLSSVQERHWRNDCLIVHEYAFIKTDRVDPFKMAFYYVRPFFQALAAERGWTLREAVSLTQAEIRLSLLKGVYPQHQIIQKRAAKECILDFRNNKLNFIYNPQKIAQIKKMVQDNAVGTRELKGIPAYFGKARGRVAVVTDKKNINKVKPGDILVAIWTTPHFVPAMKQAAAIITEEGGVTAHAAVIARELGKPCIQNIINVTRILKDGDVVEVDAEKGIVRKITN